MNIHSFRQEFVSKQVQVQWSRYRYTIQLHCTGKGSVVQGYRYNIQVQVKVHCSGTLYRYTIQLNYKGTEKWLLVQVHNTVTLYSYRYTIQV